MYRYIYAFLLLFSICFAADLRITEVFPYTKNEWIEIYNADSSAFSGEIQITGIKSKPWNKIITILPHQTLIIGDDISLLDISVLSRQGLSMSDDKSLYIELLVKGVLLDDFKVSQDQITANKNKTSFEKIFIGNENIIKATNIFSDNKKINYLSNPGIVHFLKSGQKSEILKDPVNTEENNKEKVLSIKSKKKTRQVSNMSNSSLIEENEKLQNKVEELETKLKLTRNVLSMFVDKFYEGWQDLYEKYGFKEIYDSYAQLYRNYDNIFVMNGNIYDLTQITGVKDGFDLYIPYKHRQDKFGRFIYLFY